MYTRSYNDDTHGIVIPESYGGTLLRESEHRIKASDEDDENRSIRTDKNPWETHEQQPDNIHKDDESAEAFSFLSKIPISNFLSNILGKSKFSLQKIGTEEILIIATAAFLFFSKEGDKECAIMLLLLLFLA